MIDTHSHLLPGLDHGCPDMDTCLQMAKAAAGSGVTTVVCTPHLLEWDHGLIESARETIGEVRSALVGVGIELELLLGFEVDLGVVVSAEVEDIRGLTIEGSEVAILLEMPYTGWPQYLEQSIYRLSLGGLVPVLAHPERNDYVQKSPELLAKCLRSGAVAQATAGSLSGMFGQSTERTFRRLISEGLISLVASDAHAHWDEGWTMAPMLEVFDGWLTVREVSTLTETNARELLAGKHPRPVVPAAGAEPRRGRAWLSKRR
ncbi:MAG: hypothetical protein JW990_02100 [Thermoleophilia bacterium]|nr:hypothetical protein [Thermoleophilia bacterium]